jgi:hypothetical protein
MQHLYRKIQTFHHKVTNIQRRFRANFVQTDCEGRDKKSFQSLESLAYPEF